jgi:ABC-type transport system substrate-binding protein
MVPNSLAEDVKATYDRIVKPPQGVSIPRTPLFATVSEINVRDRYTIEFKLSGATADELCYGCVCQRLEYHRA